MLPVQTGGELRPVCRRCRGLNQQGAPIRHRGGGRTWATASLTSACSVLLLIPGPCRCSAMPYGRAKGCKWLAGRGAGTASCRRSSGAAVGEGIGGGVVRSGRGLVACALWGMQPQGGWKQGADCCGIAGNSPDRVVPTDSSASTSKLWKTSRICRLGSSFLGLNANGRGQSIATAPAVRGKQYI